MPKPGLLKLAAVIFYDSVLLVAVLFFATLAALPFNEGKAFENSIPYIIYLFLISFLYFGWFWTHGGQTLGLKTWKLRLRALDDRPITWKQALIRFIAAFFSWAFCGLGFFWIVFNKNRYSWHDMASKTTLFLD